MPPLNDWLVCGVSTQLRQQVAGFDEVIAQTDAGFHRSGLKATSVIRLGFLAVLPGAQILGVLGAISPECHSRLLQRLSAFLLT